MPGTTSENLVASHDLVPPDHYFPAHSHLVDQLMWAPGGGMHLRVSGSRWRIHGDHFAWVPAHADHEVRIAGSYELLSLYLDAAQRPPQERFGRPLVLPADPVASAIIRQLCTTEASPRRQEASLALLLDILEHTPESYDALALPTDARARVVAEAILASPAAEDTLAEWAARLGVSTKTLLRAFLAETGLTFGQWRTRARTYAAERMISEGVSVAAAAERTGYATTTGFIKAFRHTFGTTPAAYARAKRRSAA